MAAVLAAQAGTTLELIDTPVVTIDLDVMDQNIARLQSYLSLHGLRNRPHVKTHKIPSIARMQVAAGAAGITCQKLGEAEVMAEGGLDDILLTYNVLGEAKLERLVALADRISLTVTVDHADIAAELSQAMRRAGLMLPVLIECDTGGRRCGVQTPAEAGVCTPHRLPPVSHSISTGSISPARRMAWDNSAAMSA